MKLRIEGRVGWEGLPLGSSYLPLPEPVHPPKTSLYFIHPGLLKGIFWKKL